MQLQEAYKTHVCIVAMAFALLAPSQLVAGTLFSDDFSSGVQAHWSAVDQKTGSVLVTGNAGWTGYVVSAQVRAVEQDDVIGLLFGYRDKGNYYRFSIDRQQGKRTLEKAVNGAISTLAEDRFAVDGDVRYAVEAKLARGAVEILVDGRRVFHVSDVSHNGGKIGLYSRAPLDSWSNVWSRFDAVKVSTGDSLASTALEAAVPLAAGDEALAFDWNQIITQAKGRFIEGRTQWKPNNPPVRANTDWTLPPNFANGTLYFRVLIRRMKTSESFKLIYNHWQTVNGKLAEATLIHNSYLNFNYTGTPITRTFSFPVSQLKSQHLYNPAKFNPFSWRIRRDLVGFFPPAFAGTPASNALAQSAMPLDIRFTVVVVGQGKTFSGWQNY